MPVHSPFLNDVINEWTLGEFRKTSFKDGAGNIVTPWAKNLSAKVRKILNSQFFRRSEKFLAGFFGAGGWSDI